MNLLQTLVLSILQGITEFLPISSSAHLILVPVLTGWQDQGLVFDIAVHVGSLLAVIYYFRLTLGRMIKDWSLSCMGRGQTQYSHLAWGLGFATIPVGLVGLFFGSFISEHLRDPVVLAAGMIVFGILLGWADRRAHEHRSELDMNWKDFMFIGVAQVFALMPGASRSGVTMMAGLMRGLSREATSKFSFLLSIPVILLAGGYEATQVTAAQWARADLGLLALGVLVSATIAFTCIHFFIKLIERIGMMPFVIYRIFLGIVLLVVFL